MGSGERWIVADGAGIIVYPRQPMMFHHNSGVGVGGSAVEVA